MLCRSQVGWLQHPSIHPAGGRRWALCRSTPRAVPCAARTAQQLLQCGGELWSISASSEKRSFRRCPESSAGCTARRAEQSEKAMSIAAFTAAKDGRNVKRTSPWKLAVVQGARVAAGPLTCPKEGAHLL